MSAKERVIIVDWSQYYVPGVVKVQDQSGGEHLVVTSASIVHDNMLILERVEQVGPFFIPDLWRVKESKAIESGISS